MKHFLAITAGVGAGVWIGPYIAQLMGLQATGGLDAGDAVSVMVTVLLIFMFLSLASMF